MYIFIRCDILFFLTKMVSQKIYPLLNIPFYFYEKLNRHHRFYINRIVYFKTLNKKMIESYM